MSARTPSPLLLPLDDYSESPDDKARVELELSLGMVPVGDPVLTQVARTVSHNDISSPRVQRVIARLFAAATGQRAARKLDGKRRMLVGLAAPQIGEDLQIVVFDTKIGTDRKKPGKLECFINPEIIWRSRETEEGREGCFSAGSVWGLVRRPVAVKIKAFITEGTRATRIFEGFQARIAQHEIDHLNGIRFPDRIKSDKKRHWVHAEKLSNYPIYISQWPRHCSYEQWLRLKLG
ncbi:MAG: peptide deformylase [Candidatus Saccharimonadales bacterium]